MANLEQMVLQQRVLADFGEFALQCEDLDAVLTKACQLICEALGTDLAKVLEIEHAQNALLVRAGVGWQAGVVGEIRLPMTEHSSETFAIEQGLSVITPNIRAEERFGFPAYMTDAGVQGIISVPIFLPGHKPYGLLQVDSRYPWHPDEDDIAYLKTYATVLGPVIDRLNNNYALQQARDRNETLLHELQHRIKNNIAAITGLIRMRMKQTQSEEARRELRVVGERIEARRLAHEQVYMTRCTDRLALEPYIKQLLEGLLTLHGQHDIRLDVQIDDIMVDSDTAIPLGLVLNEFTTNSMKYAFNDAGNREHAAITVAALKSDEVLKIVICDNGRGLPAKAAAPDLGSGTGMGLIEGLSRQINANANWSSEGGTTLSLDILLRNPRAPNYSTDPRKETAPCQAMIN